MSNSYTMSVLFASGLLMSPVFGVSIKYTNSDTFIPPAGVTSITVECWGGGGAGGSSQKTTGATGGGGGGGGGAYAKMINVAVTPGNPYTITIPPVAVAPSSGFAAGDRVDGASVSFTGDMVTVTANGGQGGACAVDNTGTGGAGGAAGTGLDAAFAGGNGATHTTGNAGAGGSGASDLGDGNNGANSAAGATKLGSDADHNGGAGGSGKTGAGNGNAGTAAPGGGGGGAKTSVTNTIFKGASGAKGQIIISFSGATITKANNTDNLEIGTSWVGGTAPDSTATAKWDSTVMAANTTSLGNDLFWGSIVITNPGGPVTVNAGNKLTLAGGIDMSAATTNLALNCDYVMGGPTNWNVATGQTLTLGGGVEGPQNITKLGAGKVVLSGANTYTGITAVNAGILQLGATEVIPDGGGKGNVSLATDTILDLNGFSETINGLIGLGVVDNTAPATTSVLTVGNGSATAAFPGVIQNTAAGSKTDLVKIGTGTVTLQGTNTLTGSVTVSGGNLTLNSTNPLDNISGLSIGNAVLGSSTNNTRILAPITLTGNANFMTQVNGIITNLTGAIGGTGNVTFSTANNTLNLDNKVLLGGAGTFVGNATITTTATVTTNNLTVQLGIENALPVTSVLTIDGQNGSGASWSDLDLNGFSQTLSGLQNAIRTGRLQRVYNSSTTPSTLTINNTDPYSFGGRLGKVGGDDFGLTKNGTGNFTISGTNTYTGATTVTAGTLTLAGSSALPDTSAVSLGASTLDAMAAGTDVAGTLAVTGAATINLAADANLAFADSSATAWTGTLAVTGTFVSGQSLRFGSSASALTPAQLALISIPSIPVLALNSDGYVIPKSSDPFIAWSGGASFTADANNDCVVNGMAWLLGAANANASATNLTPTVNQTGTGLVLSFRCLKVEGRGGATLSVQHSSDLGNTDAWASAEVPDADSTVNNVVFDTTDDGDYINVIATIPTAEAVNGKLFGRLNANPAP